MVCIFYKLYLFMFANNTRFSIIPKAYNIGLNHDWMDSQSQKTSAEKIKIFLFQNTLIISFIFI